MWLELRLFEVRRHPKILERNQRQQVLPRRDILVDLNALARDDAVCRRDNFVVAQVELGLIELGLRLLHLRLGLLGAGVLRCHLLRTGLARTSASPAPALRCRGPRSRRPRRPARWLRVGQRGFVGVGRGNSRVELLLADHVLLDQRLVAIQVLLSLDVVGLGLRHLCVRSIELLFRLLPLRRVRRSHRRSRSSGCCRC